VEEDRLDMLFVELEGKNFAEMILSFHFPVSISRLAHLLLRGIGKVCSCLCSLRM
jgi:hypothetical protein